MHLKKDLPVYGAEPGMNWAAILDMWLQLRLPEVVPPVRYSYVITRAPLHHHQFLGDP